MSQRFNFLLQVILIAIIFSFSSHTVHGQFRSGVKTQSSTTDTGGNDENLFCIESSESIFVDLIFKYSALLASVEDFSALNGTEVDLSNIDFGCNLYVGITSDQSNHTLYSPLSNIDSAYVEYEGIEIDGNSAFYRSWIVELELGLPKTEVSCSVGHGFSDETFTLDLYCFNGNDFEQVDACSLEEVFYLDLLQTECSFATGIVVRVCCNTREITTGDEDIRTGNLSVYDSPLELPNVEFSYNELTVLSVRKEDYKVNIKIINLNGQSLFERNVVLRPLEKMNFEVIGLLAGAYVCVVNDGNGNFISKKIIIF